MNTANPKVQKSVANFCNQLRKMPMVGDDKADRVQAFLLHPKNGELASDVLTIADNVGGLLNPFLGSIRQLITSFGNVLHNLTHHSSDHAYQTTLQRWIRSQPKGKGRSGGGGGGGGSSW